MLHMSAIANCDLLVLMHLDYDALPFSPILSCGTKSACWEECVRPLTYVVLLRHDSILKGVFANSLVAFRFEFRRLCNICFKNFISILLLSCKSVSVHKTQFASTRNNWVIATIAIFSHIFILHMSAIANYGMLALMHLDHDTLPCFPILSCKMK